MAKELYLYYGVSSFTAEELVSTLEEYMDEEVVIRMNTPGGDVFSGYAILNKIKEHGNVTIKIDGMAASMGAFMLPFAKRVEAYDNAKVMLHRADGYTGGDENLVKLLADMNKNLKSYLDKKVDSEKFESIAGYKLKDLFDAEDRKDLWLSAKEAKSIGLIHKVNKMTPEAELKFAALFEGQEGQRVKDQKPVKSNTMTKEELKAKHPELFASVVSEAQAEEKERVKAWMGYIDVDVAKVKAGIEGSAAPTISEQIELNRKAVAKASVQGLEDGSADDFEEDDAAGKGAQAAASPEVAKVEAEIKELLNKK